MDEEVKISFSLLLKDYPFIAKGLKKLGIQCPLDLQEQILSIPHDLENLIITAPDGSGKKLALLILAIRHFTNQEEGILVFVSHSKDLSQELGSMSSAISRIPFLNLFIEKWKGNMKKCIVIGSPLQLLKLPKQAKDQIQSVIIFQADFLTGFGYGEHLEQFADTLIHPAIYQMSANRIGGELQVFKSKHMKKVTKIDYKPPEFELQRTKIERVDGQAVHFYEVGEKELIPITLYVTLKFGLVNPKVLILVKDLKQVYRYFLFLERTKISGVGLYNHENPIDLKFYSLTLWMNGPINILISTSNLYEDLANNIFRENCQKNYKKTSFSLLNLATTICINLQHLEHKFGEIFNNFIHKPFLMTFLENKESEVESLQNLIKLQNTMFESVKAKEYPISKKQLEAFKYRVNDVFMNLGNNKVEMFQKYDFKKKMAKSPDLKTYFEEHPKEKEILIKEITELKQKINHEAVTIGEHVPFYLVPECLRHSYEEKMEEVHKQSRNQQVPAYIKKARNALRHVDLEEENPETTDVSRLKLISSRKRWKLQHGFKLKKRNLRNERKGIFDS